MDIILDDQDLLEKYYRSKKVVIGEYSSSIQADTDDLISSINEYARLYGLSTEFLDRDKDGE